jgi:hypothetical protein
MVPFTMVCPRDGSFTLASLGSLRMVLYAQEKQRKSLFYETNAPEIGRKTRKYDGAIVDNTRQPMLF